MVHVKKSRVIQFEPERIWQLIIQVERFPEWMPGVLVSEVIAAPRKKGSQIGRKQLLRVKTELGESETIQEVVTWEPPTRITWQHVSDIVDGKKLDYAKEIKTTMSITNDNGNISFRMVGSWQPVGISGKLMSRIMQRFVAKNFDEALDNLERLLKQETT